MERTFAQCIELWLHAVDQEPIRDQCNVLMQILYGDECVAAVAAQLHAGVARQSKVQAEIGYRATIVMQALDL